MRKGRLTTPLALLEERVLRGSFGYVPGEYHMAIPEPNRARSSLSGIPGWAEKRRPLFVQACYRGAGPGKGL